jgi:hypothetical protein
MLKSKEKAILLIFSVFVFQLAFPQYSYSYGFDQSNVFIANTNSTTSVLADNRSSFEDNKVVFYDGGPSALQACNSYEVLSGINAFIKIENTNNSPVEASPQTIREYVLNEAKKVGLNPNEVDKIINCESRWDPKAMGHNKNGSYDAGLWQINSIHKSLTLAEKMDYKVATKWALTKRLNDGNWSAWYCARKVGIRT